MESSSTLEKVHNLLRCTVREICRLTVPYTSRLAVEGTLNFNVDGTHSQDFNFQETLINIDQEKTSQCLTVNQISLLDCFVSEAFKSWHENEEVPHTSNYDSGVSGKTEIPHNLRTRTSGSTSPVSKSQRFEKPARKKNGMYQCPLCSKEFSFGTNLTRHQRNFHGRPLKRKAKGACSSNSSEGETTLSTSTTTSTAPAILSVPTPVLSANSPAQTESKTYSDKHSCSICSQSFSSGTELQNHTRSCHSVVYLNGTLFRASPEMVASAQRQSQHIPVSSKTSVFQRTSDSIQGASFAQDTFMNTLTAGSGDDDDDNDPNNGDDSCDDSNDYSGFQTNLTLNSPNSGRNFQNEVNKSKVTDTTPSFCEASLNTKVTSQTSSLMLLSGISSMETSVSNTVTSQEPAMSSQSSLTSQQRATDIVTPCDLPVPGAILYPSSSGANIAVSTSANYQPQGQLTSPTSLPTSENHLMSPNTSTSQTILDVPSSAASLRMTLPVASPTSLAILPQGLHSPQNTMTQNPTPNTHSLVPIPSGPQQENNKYKCAICQKTFPLYRNLGRHLKKKHGKRLMDLEMQGNNNSYSSTTTHKSGNHQCHLCSHRFTFTSNLRRHMTGVHGYPIQSRKGRRKTRGTEKGKAECSTKTAKGSDNSQDDINARIRKYECKMCNAAFTFTSNLTRHLKKEHHMMWAKSLKLLNQPSPGQQKEPSHRTTANTKSPIGENQKGIPVPHTQKENPSPVTETSKTAGRSPSSKSPTSGSPRTNSPQKSPASRYRFSCGVCGSSFTFRTNLTRHMKKVHGTVPSTTDGSPGEKFSSDAEKKLAHQPLGVN